MLQQLFFSRTVPGLRCEQPGWIFCFESQFRNIAFLRSQRFLSWLIDAPTGFRKALPGVFDLVLEGLLFPITFSDREFVDAVGFFKIIRQSLSDASLPYLTYQRLE